MSGEWWNKDGRPLHEDLLDVGKSEWIANIPPGALVKIAKWWSIAEAYNHDRLKRFLLKIVNLSSSVDGFRSEQITRSIEGLRLQEAIDAGKLHPRYAASGRDDERDSSREQPRI